MFNRIRDRNTTSIIPSSGRVANCNRGRNDISGNIMVTLLKGGLHMTIVVKKVPKCLRGIVKLLFGIKE